MKRILVSSVFIGLFFFTFSCNKDENIVVTSPEDVERPTSNMFLASTDEPSSVKPWTFIFYNDADFDPGYDPANDFSRYMYSTENLNVIMLHDRFDSAARLDYVDENGQQTLLTAAGEVNMGAEETLSELIEYCKYMFPANRFIISFYDHGGGWSGACVDHTDGNDSVTMREMCNAFTDNGGVDITMFSAPCLMGSIESMYELKDCTQLYIGSENTSGYIFWWYAMEPIRQLLTTNPTISNADFGERVITFIDDALVHWPNFDLSSITMSAVNTNTLVDLKNSFAEIVSIYNDDYSHFKSLMDSVKTSVTNFHNYNVDLYDLFSQLKELETNDDTKNKIDELLENIASAVEAEIHGAEFPEAKGIAIYFPIDGYMSTHYGIADYELIWTNETLWDELILRYMADAGAEFNSSILMPEHIDQGRL